MRATPEVGIGGPMTVPADLSLRPTYWQKSFMADRELIWTRRGRDALRLICKHLNVRKGDEVLLPEFLCETAIHPFQETGAKIIFYRLDDKLDVDWEDFLTKMNPNVQIALVNNYFGFPQKNIRAIWRLCAENSTFLIEDAAQAFLSKSRENGLCGNIGDAAVFSFRKSVGVPDGALIASGIKDPKKGYEKMSPISKWILDRIEPKKIIEARRRNFSYLLRHIRNKEVRPVFTKLPWGVVPLVFPVRTDMPEATAWKLAQAKIYCPVYYPNTEKKVLGIPCDQRIGPKELAYLARCINGL